MKFSEFEYKRPEIEGFKQDFEIALKNFENGDSLEAQDEALREISRLREEFGTMWNICLIRHTSNTKDEFYEAENSFFDKNLPSYEALNTRFYEALTQSPFRKELREKWGKQLFVIAELSLKKFKPTILDDLKEENLLSSAYTKLKAGAKIPFDGKEQTLASIIPYEQNQDRTTRKNATMAKWAFFEKNGGEFESIFDKMVKVRHSIAQKLGYKNFVDVGYVRMLRSDYTPEMVANFRNQILEHVVPMVSELMAKQAKRIGLDKLMFWDESFKFASGNATPKGEPQWIVDQAKQMYKELSKETDDFFSFMLENDLLDLVAKKGKATGGYCTYISKYKSPFIFSNFNGTSGDIDVLTHEAGHAFQVFSSRDYKIEEYNWPTFEACEIHSMSMEFFTWPWMQLFFKEDTDKYKFAHMAGSLKFLPYGVAVDEFQHRIYENPNMTPAERNAVWKEMEEKYLPHRDFGDMEFLTKGTFWQRQNHIFGDPFYYIDYTLAQICAFQFWQKDQKDHDSAWADYVRLCKAGGSMSFLDLVKYANLQSPFEDGCVESIVKDIKQWLDNIDDSEF